MNFFKKTWLVILAFVFIIIGTIILILDRHNVEKRQQEQIQILFNRLNKVDAKQEQVVMPEIEKLEWLSTHRY